MIIAILAWSGALLSCLLTIPQALRTLRSDRLDGISAATYWIVLGNAIVWAAWSLLAGEYAAGVPALVNGPAAVLILRRLHRNHKAARTTASRTDRRTRPVGVPTDRVAVAAPLHLGSVRDGDGAHRVHVVTASMAPENPAGALVDRAIGVSETGAPSRRTTDRRLRRLPRRSVMACESR
jgi:uncharacterized protein with PQ loop repeat